MLNMSSWNNVKGEAKSGGSKIAVAPGGHICEIRIAIEDMSQPDSKGKQHINCVALFDIKEGGEYDGAMQHNYDVAQVYDAKNGKTTKWPGVFRREIYNEDGTTIKATFKGFIECIEQSNPGWKFTGDLGQLKGKKVGLVFRNEEYQPTGTDKIILLSKPYYPCAASKAKDEPVPAAKPLKKKTASTVMNQGMTASEEEEEQLPF